MTFFTHWKSCHGSRAKITATARTNERICRHGISALCLAAVFLVGCYFLQPRSDYIGQASFPKGDAIEITSVKRTKEEMVVKGRYNLVSADNAMLMLSISSPSRKSVPIAPEQQMPISRGRGDFELAHPDLYPGFPHVTMYSTSNKPFAGGYSTNNRPFAGVYFGSKAEALKSRKLRLGYDRN